MKGIKYESNIISIGFSRRTMQTQGNITGHTRKPLVHCLETDALCICKQCDSNTKTELFALQNGSGKQIAVCFWVSSLLLPTRFRGCGLFLVAVLFVTMKPMERLAALVDRPTLACTHHKKSKCQ
jgi:hypothetical protein